MHNYCYSPVVAPGSGGIADVIDCNIQPIDRAAVSIPQFAALGPDARVSEGDKHDGVYDMTVTVSAEPPGWL